MIKKNKYWAIVAISMLLTACGGGGSSDGGDTVTRDVSGPASTLTISGADTADTGSSLILSEYSFSLGTGGANELLIATSEGMLSLVTGGTTDVSADAIVNSVVMNIFTSASFVSVSMRINRDGEGWLYSGSSCESGFLPCFTGLTFDAESRTVTFEDVVVNPSNGDDSLSTAPLTLLGTVKWLAGDETEDPFSSTED